MRKKMQYWHGYLVGTWQYRIRPRMNLQYIRGYIIGRFGG